MRIETATRKDIDGLRDLFTRANDTSHDLVLVAEEKCFGAGFRGEPRTRVWRAGKEIAGASVTCGRHLRILAVDHEQRRNGIGTALLADAESFLRSSGEREIEIASEAGNYFTPGVPLGGSEIASFFLRRGFSQKDTAVNLTVDLTANPLVPSANGERGAIRRAAQAEKRETLDWIESHFGPIWRFETEKAFLAPSPTLFVARADGVIAGFSAHDVNNRGLGFFGPEGVDRDVRSRGFGRALLLASLSDLRALGYSKSIIPWASSIEFYEKSCGARLSDQFAILVKNLENPSPGN